MELVIRYCLLRTGPAAGTREVAIRFYAFPHPDDPFDLVLNEPEAASQPRRVH